jgi:hypothetical protein
MDIPDGMPSPGYVVGNAGQQEALQCFENGTALFEKLFA